MNWHVYHLPPVDSGWGALRTVQETLEVLTRQPSLACEEDINSDGVAGFIQEWESAKQAARDQGWEGDFREDPVVFWLPCPVQDDMFGCGFVIKQGNNGSTFVVSPQRLPDLRPA